MDKTYPVPTYDTKGYRIKARRKIARRLFKQAGYNTSAITKIFAAADWDNMTGREVFDRYAASPAQQQTRPNKIRAQDLTPRPKRTTKQQQTSPAKRQARKEEEETEWNGAQSWLSLGAKFALFVGAVAGGVWVMVKTHE